MREVAKGFEPSEILYVCESSIACAKANAPSVKLRA
jgi:hypothetical protein